MVQALALGDVGRGFGLVVRRQERAQIALPVFAAGNERHDVVGLPQPHWQTPPSRSNTRVGSFGTTSTGARLLSVLQRDVEVRILRTGPVIGEIQGLLGERVQIGRLPLFAAATRVLEHALVSL